MGGLFDAFWAFHVNAATNLAYAVMTNWWFLLLAIGAVCSIVISLKDEIQATITDEQQIL